jgi:carbonic anhydrase
MMSKLICVPCNFFYKLLFKSHEWSYTGECGPQTWGKEFRGARGNHQSPINIDTDATKFDDSLVSNPLKLSIEPNSTTQIKNTGHTFQVDADSQNQTSEYVWFQLINLILKFNN